MDYLEGISEELLHPLCGIGHQNKYYHELKKDPSR